jgi:hypothetical protein
MEYCARQPESLHDSSESQYIQSIDNVIVIEIECTYSSKPPISIEHQQMQHQEAEAKESKI